ncbi:hypothetical protein J1N35_004894 [Gossypium stocksii]|uniref:Endonuclease/exonuclease/phosphatase domain-containing protein n=1 Tax=Gossypium stocksii TaxID=47602 RepID=A0A9D3WCU0_9ROSI|nr:hypothetical protein J1N35_004894 [Gossypium stocksii]
MDSMGLQDLGLSGPNFTWSRGGVFERLDRAICNDAWNLRFPLSKVLHLQKLKSDHTPLKLSLFLEVQFSSKGPFWFLARWTEHPEFSGFVKKYWNFSGDMSNAQNSFTEHVKLWNKEVYRHITYRKNLLMKKLDNV